MELLVKLYVKEITKDKTKFKVFDAHTKEQHWYKLAMNDELKLTIQDYDREVIVLDVTKKTSKPFTTVHGEVLVSHTLWVKDYREPTASEEVEYETRHEELNATTLKDVA